MPNPIELFLSPLSLLFLGLYAALIAWEALFPARRLPVVAWWPAKGLAGFLVYFLLSSYLPLLWDPWLAPLRLFELAGQPAWLQFALGLLAYEGGVWVWHRALHRVGPLWRYFHQMHHSAERLDSFGAFWFSPLDAIGFTLLGSLSLGVLLGLAPGPFTAVMVLAFFLTIFQHLNVRTPQWLGYIVQRPESHSLHHARGVHRHNYADLPLIDLLLGTFRNPRGWSETGFRPGASGRVLDMLLGRDVAGEGYVRGQAPCYPEGDAVAG